MSESKLFAPVERRKVYELVTESLAGRIARGDLAAGEQLPSERDLADAHAVGRSSVREALRMLESRGLIESRGAGSFVVTRSRGPLNHSLALLVAADQGSAHELFEVRRLLECEAAGLAAERRTDDDLVRLDAALAEMEAALDSHDDYVDADLRYHLVIAEATGNRVIVHLMHAIRDQLLQLLGSVFYIEGGPQRSIAQHRAVTAAIVAGDAQGARRCMHDHITRVERELDEAQ